MRFFQALWVGTISVCLTLPLLAKPSAPDWLQQAAAMAVPAYDKKTKAVVLLRDVVYQVREDGIITTTERVAIRMLQPEGYEFADAICSYQTGTDSVRSSQAWLLPPKGEVIRYGPKDFREKTPTELTLASDTRLLALSASGNAVTGSVFGYEFIIESRSIFSQLSETLQQTLPVIGQTITLKLPKGWGHEAITFNLPTPVQPLTQGDTTTWRFAPFPGLPEEPAMPGLRRLSAVLCINLIVPASARTKEKLLPLFRSWSEIAAHFAPIYESTCIVDARVTAKAQELTQNAPTPLAAMQALGQHTQNINYMMIDTDLNRGGGWKPRTAPDTLQRHYGDCKDKANLLRALLRARGINSYPVAIYSGDNAAVWAQWPSPYQFNHAILAINVGPDLTSPAIVEHPQLGRLLFFDPTDEYVPFGQLPASHYGSQVLIESATNGGLITLPPLPEKHESTTYSVDATLDSLGMIEARLVEDTTGSLAAQERAIVRNTAPADFHKMITRWLSGTIRNAKVATLTTKDHFAESRLQLSATVTAPNYAQSLRGKLLLFKPALIQRRHTTTFTEPTRTHPIQFNAYQLTDHTQVRLPDDYAVSELPAPVELTSSFGRYRSSCRVENGLLYYERSLTVTACEVPASDYASVKQFYERIIKAEQASVVLERRPPPAT